MAAHAAAARGRRSIPDSPEVWAAKVEHYRAYATAAAANGVVSTLPTLYTNEVAAARAAHFAAHFAAHAEAAARGKRSVQDTPEVMAATIEHYRAYNAAATANGMPMAFLPARYANMPFGMPQPVQETAEVAAARRAHMAALAHATARG
uniref:Uncharacterized protein n=1 Tax=Daphnia galeata TaxID=27404 RepID=A0A8J2RLB6_9CRUS|nr:unnamed protein product [Daphnia galeata]